MAPIKNISESDVVTFYMDYITEYGKRPTTEEHFFSKHNIDAERFFELFDDFDELEEYIFYAFFEHTIEILEKSEEYHQFDAKNKLLSFYYTFMELLTANRDYMIFALDNHCNVIKSRERFNKLRKAFKNYIDYLDIQFISFNQETIDKFQSNSFKESMWLQLVFAIRFWKDDDSDGFEKTDVLIEKSLKATFDLINTQPIKSVLDLGKFILKEKFDFNT